MREGHGAPSGGGPRRGGGLELLCLAVLLAACDAGGGSARAPAALFAPKVPKEGADAPAADTLFVRPASLDFHENPALLARIEASAHGYFRFINVPFSEAVCERFREELPSMPSVNLHGDAHIEQYAVTSFGRGMTDFDDSSTGPAVIDLVRFGVSLRLACHQRGWGDGESAFSGFLRGYRDGLADPRLLPEAPAMVARERAGFARDRRGFLAWANGLMEPMSPGRSRALSTALRGYSRSFLQDNPDLPPTFFDIRSMGALRMGIGSALDEKYAVRVQGATLADSDDVVLEVKEIRDLSGISCIQNNRSVDPFRILVGQSRIAYAPYPYLGYVTMAGRPFWVHGWADHYRELEIGSLASLEELQQVAYDVGVQLGRGHTKQIAAPLDRQLCRRQRELVDEHESAIVRTVAEFGDRVEAAWRLFRDQAHRGDEGGG